MWGFVTLLAAYEWNWIFCQFYEFDQSEFFYTSTPAAVSMDDVGYIYVPSGCKSGTKRKYIALFAARSPEKYTLLTLYSSAS